MKLSTLIALVFFMLSTFAESVGHAWVLACDKDGVAFILVSNPDGRSYNLQTFMNGKWDRLLTQMQYLPRIKAYIGRVDSGNLASRGFKLWSQVTFRTDHRVGHLQVRDENALHTDKPTAEFGNLACKDANGQDTYRSRWIPR